MRWVIVVVGSGVVGTATGKGLQSQGHHVTYIDTNPQRLAQLRQEGLHATNTITLSDQPTIIFLTLPTPNDGNHWDLHPLLTGTHAVAQALQHTQTPHTIVVRSTVPPGTTEQTIQPLLEHHSGKKAGEGFTLASNPEFLRAHCALEDFLNPRMTVIGARSRRTQERLHDLLAPFGGEVRRFDDPAEPEIIKCAHNLYNAAKISFWNELWHIACAIGADPATIADTVARSAEASYNPNYGIRGGAPYGGACLPKDTKGFLGYAAGLGLDVPLITAIDQVNERMRALHNLPATTTQPDPQPGHAQLALATPSGNGHPTPPGHAPPATADG